MIQIAIILTISVVTIVGICLEIAGIFEEYNDKKPYSSKDSKDKLKKKMK